MLSFDLHSSIARESSDALAKLIDNTFALMSAIALKQNALIFNLSIVNIRISKSMLFLIKASKLRFVKYENLPILQLFNRILCQIVVY